MAFQGLHSIPPQPQGRLIGVLWSSRSAWEMWEALQVKVLLGGSRGPLRVREGWVQAGPWAGWSPSVLVTS